MEQKRNVQYLSTCAVALVAVTASVSQSWSIPVIPKFHNHETDINLTDIEISWLVASLFPGVMIGCLVSRFASDRFGRRATLLGATLPYAIGTIFVITATKPWQLWLARFCWGLGNGAITPVSMMYVSEIAAKEIRGRLSVIIRYMFAFGSLLVITVGSVASYQALSYMLVVLSICGFSACLWIPETPYYLLKEDKIAAAKKAIKKLNSYKDDRVLEEQLADMRSHVKEEMKNSGTIKELFTGKQYRRAILICVGLWFTHIMSGTVCLQQYLGRILQETNSDVSVSTGIITYGATRFTISIVASFLVDKVGRRPLLICSYLGVSLILTSLGTMFFLHEVFNKTPNYFGYITLFTLLLFTTVATLGFDSVNFVILGEIFPLNVRSTGMTYLNLMISVINFVTMRGYQAVIDLSGLYGVFWLFACFALSGAVFSYVVVPETKGRSLREIQVNLQGKMYDEANEKLNMNKEVEIQEMKCVEKPDESTNLETR